MADILIRGMEMPNVGEKIEFTQNIAGRIYAKFNPSRGYICEVIELSEHGDLVDRNELNNSFELSDFDGEPQDNVYSAICIVNSMPVVIPSNKET